MQKFTDSRVKEQQQSNMESRKFKNSWYHGLAHGPEILSFTQI